MTPHSEYGPTEYMQQWGKKWFDGKSRLDMAKALVKMRVNLCQRFWKKYSSLAKRSIDAPNDQAASFIDRAKNASITQDILLAEALWVKSLYSRVAKAYKLNFVREPDNADGLTSVEKVNAFLNHGNYLAYGMAGVVLNALGISYCFPLLHGKTRRGALVFDIADLIKDGIVLPAAFEIGSNPRSTETDFRAELIERFVQLDALTVLFDAVKELAES